LLDGPRTGEETLRELKLLVDHRDDLVAERRRCQQRLRWHLHELDPALEVPLGALRSTALSGSTGSHGSLSEGSRRRRHGSHASCSLVAAR
jgi:hypothetical protein